jgi:hypothetical protein
MKAFVIGFLFGFLLMACANVNPPPRDFEVKLYQGFSDTQTIETEEEVIQTNSKEFDSFICMSPEDYAKERKYQELLKKSCLNWR